MDGRLVRGGSWVCSLWVVIAACGDSGGAGTTSGSSTSAATSTSTGDASTTATPTTTPVPTSSTSGDEASAGTTAATLDMMTDPGSGGVMMTTTGETDTSTAATTGTTGTGVVCMPVGTDTGLTVADLSVGDCSLAMNAKDVYVLRDELGFYAMSSRCTHVGCLLPCPVNDLMLCPCHGSRFNANGDLLSGIAMSDLEHFLVSFECVDDEVKIYVDTSQPLADRQTRAPA